MAAAAQHDMVWVGFMDTVPVIGTMKEGVEWALALYEKNDKVAKEKEKAITELLFAPETGVQLGPEELVKHMEGCYLEHQGLMLPGTPKGKKEDPEGASASASALQDVKEVKLEELVEYVRSVPASKKKTPSHKAGEKEEREKVQKIQAEALAKIQLLIPDYCLSTRLKRETQRSRRGEHVFNNNILKFHTKLLNDMPEIKKLPYEFVQTLLRCTCTLKPHTKDDIKINMVVSFDETDFYVNANSLVYSVYCRELRSALLHVTHYSGAHNTVLENRVNKITTLMNVHEIYVDHMAKAKWIGHEQRKKDRFNEVKEEVAHMYHLRGYNWCIHIYEVIDRHLHFWRVDPFHDIDNCYVCQGLYPSGLR